MIPRSRTMSILFFVCLKKIMSTLFCWKWLASQSYTKCLFLNNLATFVLLHFRAKKFPTNSQILRHLSCYNSGKNADDFPNLMTFELPQFREDCRRFPWLWHFRVATIAKIADNFPNLAIFELPQFRKDCRQLRMTIWWRALERNKLTKSGPKDSRRI